MDLRFLESIWVPIDTNRLLLESTGVFRRPRPSSLLTRRLIVPTALGGSTKSAGKCFAWSYGSMSENFQAHVGCASGGLRGRPFLWSPVHRNQGRQLRHSHGEFSTSPGVWRSICLRSPAGISWTEISRKWFPKTRTGKGRNLACFRPT